MVPGMALVPSAASSDRTVISGELVVTAMLTALQN